MIIFCISSCLNSHTGGQVRQSWHQHDVNVNFTRVDSSKGLKEHFASHKILKNRLFSSVMH